jgi:hypothetical protein
MSHTFHTPCFDNPNNSTCEAHRYVIFYIPLLFTLKSKYSPHNFVLIVITAAVVELKSGLYAHKMQS